MNALLSHPAVQSGLLPFVVALVTATALRPLRLSGLAAVAGFAACVAVVIGFQVMPLSASRKIVLATLVGAAVGVLIDFLPLARARWLRGLLAICGAAEMVWVLVVALGQRELPEALGYGAGLAVFAGFVVWAFDRLYADPVRAGAAGLATGLAAGGAAIIGASALLGQLGLSVGAASGGYLLVQMVGGKPLPGGRVFTLPAGLACGFVAGAAVVLAKLPWYVLPLLALSPIAAGIPAGGRWPAWAQAVVFSLLALAPGAAALAIAWHRSGSVPF